MDISVFDPDYVQKQQVASLRRQADTQNGLRLGLYQQASADWITSNMRNRDLGLAITPQPTPPKLIVVSDAGVWSEVEWSQLKAPELPAPVITQSTGLRPDPSKVPPDRIDQVIQGLGFIFAEVKSLESSVSELKALVSSLAQK